MKKYREERHQDIENLLIDFLEDESEAIRITQIIIDLQARKDRHYVNPTIKVIDKLMVWSFFKKTGWKKHKEDFYHNALEEAIRELNEFVEREGLSCKPIPH